DRRRARQAVPAAADVAEPGAAGRAAGDGRVLPRDDRHRASPGHRSRLPVGGAVQRRPVPGGRAGHRPAAVPAVGRGRRRRREHRRRGAGRHVALPAHAAGRAHPPAAGQARGGHGLHAHGRGPRGGLGARARHAAVRRVGAAAVHQRHQPDDDPVDLAHRARGALRRLVDARCGGRGAVPVDRHRLPAGGGPRRGGAAGGVHGAGGPGGGAVRASLPADALLAGLRGPVPRSGPVARPGARHAAPGGVRRRVPDRRLGELHDEGRGEL
ncbi:MAG: Efflux ABC transporter, permease protein, partial [uncultured Frankineae bacterium]